MHSLLFLVYPCHVGIWHGDLLIPSPLRSLLYTKHFVFGFFFGIFGLGYGIIVWSVGGDHASH
jgi:hypothetical protein